MLIIKRDELLIWNKVSGFALLWKSVVVIHVQSPVHLF